MLTVTLFTREDCHLCDQVKVDLQALEEKYPHTLIVVDVDSDPVLQEKYGEILPVLEIGPYRKQAPIKAKDLEITLAAASDRVRQLESLEDPKYKMQQERSSKISAADRISYWLSEHYMMAANLLVLLYVGVPFLAPVFMKVGWTAPATVIYRGYSLVCHNLGFRSWFLFGEQAAYPRQSADVDTLKTFSEATGLSEGNTASDLFAARRYVGNEQVGYKVAFCERDVAIYSGILAFGLIFVLFGQRIPGLHWALWLLIGMGPIALDGFSQLLSQPPFELWAYRESTPFLRTLTGGVFGITTAWYGFPIVKETMKDTRRALLVKFRRLGISPD